MSTIKADAITASTGTNTNIAITGKGTGKLKLGDGELLFPDVDGSANQYIKTDGSANLAWATPASADVVLLSTTNASTASTVDLTGNFTTTYSNYMVRGVDIFGSNSTETLMMQVIFDSTAITGSVYYGHLVRSNNSSNNYSGQAMNGTTAFNIINQLSSGSTQGTGFVLNVLNAPATNNSYKFFTWNGASAEGWSINYGAGGVNDASSSNMTGMRFLMSAGTVSGKFLLYGIK